MSSGTTRAATPGATRAAGPAAAGAPTPPVLTRGARLGAWELLAPVGQGGMGAVWAARGAGGALVAIKTILPGQETDAALRAMFLDEARLAQLLSHLGVCRLVDFGNERGTLYMVLEWVDGGSVREAVKAAGPPPTTTALRVVRRVCEALHAAHELTDERGEPLHLVHRDVSPQNVLVNLRGEVKLIDFGIAKTRQRISETTSSGVLKGKLRYMAPEQIEGGVVDRRADVWALGALLHHLASGEELFGQANEADILRMVVMREPLPPPATPLPAPVARVVAQALAFEPSARFVTARAMRDAIDACITELGGDASDGEDASEVAAYASRALGPALAERRAAIELAARALEATVPRRARRRCHRLPRTFASPRRSLGARGGGCSSPPRSRGSRPPVPRRSPSRRERRRPTRR